MHADRKTDKQKLAKLDLWYLFDDLKHELTKTYHLGLEITAHNSENRVQVQAFWWNHNGRQTLWSSLLDVASSNNCVPTNLKPCVTIVKQGFFVFKNKIIKYYIFAVYGVVPNIG